MTIEQIKKKIDYCSFKGKDWEGSNVIVVEKEMVFKLLDELASNTDIIDIVSESVLNDDIELELRQRTQELPNKTTAGEKLYYEAGWRESAKHTKMLISHSR